MYKNHLYITFSQMYNHLRYSIWMYFCICVDRYIYNKFIIIYIKCKKLYTIRNLNKIMHIYLSTILIRFNLIFNPFLEEGGFLNEI